jgi:hypothetical protein
MLRKIAAFVVATLASMLTNASYAADRVVAPAVPSDIEVTGGYKPFLRAHAIGTQNYICAPAATASGLDWLFIGPQATLFDVDGEQILTHFQSRNPLPGGAIEATWQHSRDSSAVWAKRRIGSSDPAYVAQDAIEWLLLDATAMQAGPGGGDKLTRTLLVQRVNTIGGLKPPAAQCTASAVNARRLVPYEADYYFYQ